MGKDLLCVTTDAVESKPSYDSDEWLNRIKNLKDWDRSFEKWNREGVKAWLVTENVAAATDQDENNGKEENSKFNNSFVSIKFLSTVQLPNLTHDSSKLHSISIDWWASNPRPHRCLWRTYPRIEDFIWPKSLVRVLKGKKICNCSWLKIHLMGWVPTSIPLQFKAIIALSACPQKQLRITSLFSFGGNHQN